MKWSWWRYTRGTAFGNSCFPGRLTTEHWNHHGSPSLVTAGPVFQPGQCPAGRAEVVAPASQAAWSSELRCLIFIHYRGEKCASWRKETNISQRWVYMGVRGSPWDEYIWERGVLHEMVLIDFLVSFVFIFYLDGEFVIFLLRKIEPYLHFIIYTADLCHCVLTGVSHHPAFSSPGSDRFMGPLRLQHCSWWV